MARNFDQIVLDLATYILGKNPKIDVSPGQVVRDILIDGPASEFENLYSVADQIKLSQSLLNAEQMSSQDMDNLASNFGVTRKPPSAAVGTVIFYSETQPIGDYIFSAGTRVATDANFGNKQTVFRTIDPARFLSALEASYYNTNTGRWEIQVNAVAENPGSAGNVSAYAITQILNISSPFQVTNNIAFTGGSDEESNTALASRTLDTFTGNNKGTRDGYEGTIKTQDGVFDALVVGPGENLMIRDGGQGGKVDIWVLTATSAPIELNPKNNDSLEINWDYTQQSLNDFTFILPFQPMVTDSPVVVSGIPYPYNDINTVTLYESRSPAPPGVPYINPGDYHYTVIKSNDLNLANSIYSSDRIIWNPDTLEQLRTYPSGTNKSNLLNLYITYSYNSAISNLQGIIDQPSNKIITADVLIKSANRVKIDISASVNVLPAYKATNTVKNQTTSNIVTEITNYLNSNLLAQKVEKSDIIQVIHNVIGIDNVILNTVKIHRRYDDIYNIDSLEVENYRAEANEYLTTGNINITII